MELEQQKLARRKAITKVALISAAAILCSDMAMADGAGAAASSPGSLVELAGGGITTATDFLQTKVARLAAIGIIVPSVFMAGVSGGMNRVVFGTIATCIGVLASLPNIVGFIG